MTTKFRKLFTLAVSHGYYSDECRDFNFVIPGNTSTLLRNGKLIAKVLDGKLNVLYEADDEGTALVTMAGAKLRFGMKLINPLFSNITDFAAPTPLYRNSMTAEKLDPPLNVALTGRLLCHAITKTSRPVTVSLKNQAGQRLLTETITAENDRSTVSCELSGQSTGAYSLLESYAGENQEFTYYADPELLQANVFGIIEIEINSDFYISRPSFTISFNAKQETLKYYVVASNYNATEFEHLSVTDNGFAEEGRELINFTRVPSDAFTADEIQPGTLARGNAKIVLFKSQTAVLRQESARKKIQLSKNGDILIKHLPQAGADRTSGDIVIHIFKP
jgi:hypothetical protein